LFCISDLGTSSDSDSKIIDNLKEIISIIGDIPLGIAESVKPYRRLLGSNILQYILNTDNILFYFDECGSVNQIKEKYKYLGSPSHSLKVFNLNTTTFLDSLNVGVNGYAGRCSTVFPKFYAWLYNNRNDAEKCQLLQSFLSMADLCIDKYYPLSTKILLKFNDYFDNIQGVTRIELVSEILEEDILRLNQVNIATVFALSSIEEQNDKQKKKDKSSLL